MSRKTVLWLVIAASFAASLAGRRYLPSGPVSLEASGASGSAPVERIVSMAPSITEVLFALGLGEKVKGVTRYCDYPPEALSRPRVGGYLDPNYEAVLALQPDLVIILAEQAERISFFEELNLRCLVVDQSGVEGIQRSVLQIGRACGAGPLAEELAGKLRARIERVRARTAGLPRPGVMVTVGRNLTHDSLKDLYISGRDGYYDELIGMAGGVNVYRERTVAFPTVSAEGIRELDPAVIIDMIPDLDKSGADTAACRRAWDFASGVAAVDSGRVYVFGEDYVVRPGPRFILLLEDMARAIHPEVDWDRP
jgi:iron complex transport system substrate-binding protein